MRVQETLPRCRQTCGRSCGENQRAALVPRRAAWTRCVSKRLYFFCSRLLFTLLHFSSSPSGVLLEKDYEVYRDYSVDGHLLHCR